MAHDNTEPFNPLAINLRRQTQHLASLIPPGTPCIAQLQSASSTQEFLSILSQLLSNPAYTQIIATLFRPILIELCARWLDEGSEDNLVALTLLIEVHEELFPILSRLLQKFFPNGPLAFLSEFNPPSSVEASRIHRLLLSYYRIFQANRQLPGQLQWPLAPLSQLIWTEGVDNGLRLLAIRCYAIQAEMGEVESEKLEQQLLGAMGEADCPLEYGMNVDGTRKFVDGWIMEPVEIQRVREERGRLVTESVDFYAREEGDPMDFMQNSDLSASIENVEGVLLLKSSKIQGHSPHYIPIPTSNAALCRLAHHISLRLPTLLTSAPSAGKALLLNHIATILHPDTKNQIVTLHLADTSLDARALLGSYLSSATQPGTFEWKEGVLVRAMREGKWIALEDVDRGSNEVLGTLKPLVESLRAGKWIGGRASIHVPGRGEVVAHEDFLIFATRSVPLTPSQKFPAPTFFSAHKFYEITLNSPSLDELNTIVATRFPRLAGNTAKAIIHMWNTLNTQRTASSREFGLQDLMKFSRRIEKLLPPTSNTMDIDAEQPTLSSVFTNPALKEDVYLEARDVFFGAGTMTAASRAAMEVVASIVGEHLGLDPDRCQWLTDRRTPDFQVETDANGSTTGLLISRTYLPSRKVQSTPFAPSTRPFALHRPAVCLLSRIANAVSHEEPVLLTGETGTGKTSVVTHLASTLRRPLISLNLSQQTESSDLIGGLKPVDARIPGSSLQERFSELFGATFSRKKNEKFETSVRKAVNEGKWKRVAGLWKESVKMAQERYKAKQQSSTSQDVDRGAEAAMPRKRRKVEGGVQDREQAWATFLKDVEEFEVQHVHGKGKFAFGFVEGPLIKALRSGDWILLDEINLASSETLECISSLLHGPTASITLTEHGELEPVPRHPDFRLFACMNPATDVGKKDLPPNIRSKFTEIDVPPPDADKDTLLSIIEKYIGPHAVSDKGAIMNVAEFYLAVKDLAEKRLLADGSNHRPHFSMRTLTRALTFAADIASTYSLRRAIWEGCLMAFTMVLDSSSAELVMALAHKHLLAGVRNPRSMLSREPNAPQNVDDYVKFGPFYLAKGPLPQDPMEHYIMTPSVETKLKDLARIILTRRFPVLIEGPTSAGKTSSIEYLAKRTGHEFIRINNHEHTDIQEYIGSYVSDPTTGKLVFKDGLLVQALRKGSWIVLDELNLAPTDVMEALNRLLDDNRELVIPETHEVVRPHPHFMLFATQNPPGLYAGRKILSRAFRNRFLEVQFEDVPQAELEVILCERCRIAPSYGKKIVEVFRQLQKRRQSSRVFESKQGFVTLRDLFRWAGRDAVGYQELAENGYMLLAERTRREEDKVAVKEVIESVMKVRIDESSLYDLRRYEADLAQFLGCSVPPTNIIWTKAMQRLFILLSRALKFNEPVLLVGETGSGKTSVCQVFADAVNRRLHGLSCHQNTETADIIGGLRPLRNRHALTAETIQEAASLLQQLELIGSDEFEPQVIQQVLDQALKSSDLGPSARATLEAVRTKLVRSQSIFEWRDGPLIEAMRTGEVFLLDEISLAEDSVLERLNSVLEPDRTIVLAERGGAGEESPVIQADEGFRLVATMNPGGDYGKKELSPALRNRFTEIWVPQVDDRHDLQLISDSMWLSKDLHSFTGPMLDFIEWLCARIGDRSILTLRDILAWITFVNSMHSSPRCSLGSGQVFHHGAHMTYLDGLSSLPQLSGYSRDAISKIRVEAVEKLQTLVPMDSSLADVDEPSRSEDFIKLGPFSLKIGEHEPKPHLFTLSAPTTQDNAMRLVRACQVSKPILLEGSPGVGKTSLVVALANIAGQHLHRINLSDQTDLVDLFGSDLPVEGGRPGEFAWRDGEFLQALQLGHWVLLDEMNLAPQAVLEGLNAVLDHRGSVFIPELGRSFNCHPSFRIFAAQNPLSQGGGRKGLPKSFVNRFTKVYVEELTADDYLLVCRHLFPDIEDSVLQVMITFNSNLNQEVVVKKTFAREGFPWEFNLRDVIRWGSLMSTQTHRQPTAYLNTVYLQRFRTQKDRELAQHISDSAFFRSPRESARTPALTLTSSRLEIGHLSLPRHNFASIKRSGRVLQRNLTTLESLGDCISHSWLSIIVGGRNSGKTELIRSVACLAGNEVHEISVNSATDTMDILGSFEQVDVRAQVTELLDNTSAMLHDLFRTYNGSRASSILQKSSQELQSIRTMVAAGSLSGQLQRTRALFQDLAKNEDIPKDRLATMQSKLEEHLAGETSTGRFEWVDGPLVSALKSGDWIVLDGANLCNPSVLDRINSLCENNGRLVLSERGFVNGHVEVIAPHKDFRLFMTVDPHYGELSRAMRNRGIEITLTGTENHCDHAALQDHLRLPPLTQHGSHCTVEKFDAIRRGYPFLTLEEPIPSSALGVVQCSHRSPGFLDQATSLSFAAQLPQIASIPVILRTTIPTLLPLIRRHDVYSQNKFSSSMPSWGQMMETLSDTNFLSGLAIFHNMANPEDQSSSVTRIAKPLDFYLVSNGPQSRDQEDGLSPHHLALLNYLDLVSCRFLSGVDESTSIPANQLSEQHTAIVRETQIIFSLVKDIVSDLTGEFLTDPYGRSPDARMACMFFSLALNLGQVVQTVPFDFSRAHAISRWLIDLLDNVSPAFARLSYSIQGLKKMLSLTKGLGLTEVWDSFYACLPEDFALNIQRFSSVSRCLANEPKFEAVRHQIVDTMSVGLLPLEGDSLSKYAELKSNLDSLLSNIVATTSEATTPTDDSFDPTALALELSIMSERGAEKFAKAMQRYIHLGCRDEEVPLAHLVPYQRLTWSAHPNSDGVRGFLFASISWLEAVWKLHDCSSVSPEIGPGFLRKPIYLLNALKSCSTDSVPLSQLANFTKRVGLQKERMYLECENLRSRSEMLEAFFLKNLELITSCFHESHGELVNASLRQTPPQNPLKERVPLLLQSDSKHFKASVAKYLQPLIDESPSSGLAWIALGGMLLSLTIPNIPIDPASIRNAEFNRLTRDEDALRGQVTLHQFIEKLQTGDESNELLRYLHSQLENVHEALRRTRHLPERHDIPRLHQFWNEVGQFLDTVLNPSKTEALVGSLGEGDEKGVLQEEVLQESLSSFYQRLDSHYQDFSDLTLIVKLAIQYCRLGLRLLASSSPSSNEPQDQFMLHVVSYPRVNSVSRVLESVENTDALGANAFSGILLGVAAVATRSSAGVDSQNWIPVLDELYQQARGLWAVDRAKERDALAASSSLYRRSNMDHSAMTDGEIEEQEFLALFPNFEDVMEDASAPQTGRSIPSLFASEDQESMLCDLHISIMFPRRTGFQADAESVFNELRKQTLQSFLEALAEQGPATLDHVSLPFRFALFQDKLGKLEGTPHLPGASSSQRPNFYLDTNIGEVKRAIPILAGLLQRLESLQSEWPDQEVLRHLSEVCQKVLDIDSHSPVAKILSALEQLLLRTEDWEIYANRENTLRVHREALIALIVEWRRLELSSWQTLLESEVSQCRRGGAKWWFQLYDAAIRGVLNAAAEEEQGQSNRLAVYLRELVSLLVEFMTSSSLGEFPHRLELLASFSAYSTSLMFARGGMQRRALERVHILLSSTHQYFNLFSEAISARLVSARVPLEKEIRDFIKLASWKDINVLALKQSAQRSHHQLYKIVRKFRDALKQPISGQIVPQFVSTPQRLLSPLITEGTSVSARLSPPEDLRSTVGYLARLQKTFVKFEDLVHRQIKPRVSSVPSERAEEVAIEILSSCQRLASLTVPATIEEKEKRVKFLKSVQSQKRKAWSDLLKELKIAGFSHHAKPELLDKNTDLLWISEQPPLPQSQSPVLVNKIEEYFCKLRGCLPALRAASTSHHDDINSRDLSKGVAVVEYLFHTTIELRASLARSTSTEIKLAHTLQRLKSIDVLKISFYGDDLGGYLARSHAYLCQLSKMLQELISSIRTLHLTRDSGALSNILDQIVKRLEECHVLQGQISSISRIFTGSSFPVLQEGEQKTLQECPTFVSSLGRDFEHWTDQQPQITHLLLPAYEWMSARSADLGTVPLPRETMSSSATSHDAIQTFINAMLVIAQSSASLCEQMPQESVDQDENDRYLARTIDFVRRMNQVLVPATVHSQLTEVLSRVSDLETAKEVIPRIIPFLDIYLNLFQDQLAVQARSVKSLFKLDYVLCSVVHTIATQGFCRPPEEDGDGGGEEVTENSSGGVGLGEGSGKENVSKEIEDESQVEGLQGDEAEAQPREKGKDEKDDALEMTEDFGGELEDVPDDESDGDSASDEENNDPEERMEDLDPLDPNAVDEKIWGDDESGPEGKDDDDQTNQDNSKGQDGKSEVVAKEGKDRQSGKEKEDQPNAPEDAMDADATEGEGEQQEKEMEPDMEDETEPNANGAPMDEHVPEGDVLDLPDDVDLGEEGTREDVDMDALEDDLGDVENEEMQMSEEMEGHEGPDGDESQPETRENPVGEEDAPLGEEEQPDLTAQTGDDEKPDEVDSEENELTGKADISDGDGVVDPEETAGGVDQSTSSGQAGASRRGGERSADTEDKTVNDQGPTENQQVQSEPQVSESDTKGTAAADGQQGANVAETEFKQIPNPLRSLGDALKEIQQRFEDIMNSQETEAPPPKAGDVDAKSRQLEYLRPEDDDSKMQALGPAEQHDAAKLSDLRMADGDEEDGTDAPMDLDHEITEAAPETSTFEPPALDHRPSHSKQPDIEGAILQQSSKQSELSNALPNDGVPKADAEQAELDQAAEAQLRNWRVADYPPEGAEALWRAYESLTHDLAYALCEQLRLILEPTLATRLKGDYRTGKRLNMKKVISYIASDYTKDKIWLRRTKPSQREYQVLIAIDDSRSMAESHSIHLAYETLALIGKALNRLESGDISVVKFGEAVDVVHGFDDGPFTDQAGAKVVDAFRFNQKATNMLSLLETSLSVLETARERRGAGSSSAADLWQLEIIISDGMCQDHEKLRTMLRRAEEKRVMVVFIILDSLHTSPKAGEAPNSDAGKRSILNMDKAEFKNVDGRMELQLQKYLDSFPFEYYVVLRDVEALPDVLSSTLKQFFERISEQ